MTAPAPALDTLVDPTRLAALAAYDILDTAPEKGFDDIVLLARNICETPVALVSLVAGDRQWFKARLGFPECGTDLNASVCKGRTNFRPPWRSKTRPRTADSLNDEGARSGLFIVCRGS